MPAATPVTTPVVAFTVAAAGLLLLQLPPGVPPMLVKLVDKPAHTDVAPLTVPPVGTGLAVTLKVVDDEEHSVVTA